jgi:hypothetical protein
VDGVRPCGLFAKTGFSPAYQQRPPCGPDVHFGQAFGCALRTAAADAKQVGDSPRFTPVSVAVVTERRSVGRILFTLPLVVRARVVSTRLPDASAADSVGRSGRLTISSNHAGSQVEATAEPAVALMKMTTATMAAMRNFMTCPHATQQLECLGRLQFRMAQLVATILCRKNGYFSQVHTGLLRMTSSRSEDDALNRGAFCQATCVRLTTISRLSLPCCVLPG